MEYVAIDDLNMGLVYINPNQISSFGLAERDPDNYNKDIIYIKMANDDVFEVLASDYDSFDDFIELISDN